MNAPKLQKAKTYAGRDMDAPETYAALGGNVVVFTTRCPGKSSSNEDAAAVIPQSGTRGVLVVADGMGGAAAGEQASRLAVECIQNAAAEAKDTDALLRTTILNGIERANRSILELGIGAATTLVAMEIEDGVVRPYHVGDSTAIIVGQRGKVKLTLSRFCRATWKWCRHTALAKAWHAALHCATNLACSWDIAPRRSLTMQMQPRSASAGAQP